MSELDALVSAVLATPKYRAVCADTVRRLGAAELAKRGGLKQAVKATKARLHQVFGAFGPPPDYERLFRGLAAAHARSLSKNPREAATPAILAEGEEHGGGDATESIADDARQRLRPEVAASLRVAAAAGRLPRCVSSAMHSAASPASPRLASAPLTPATQPTGILGQAPVGDAEAFREACRAAMACHASTRERLPLLGRFHAEVFAVTGVPRRVLDLACGLHPLAIPWMGLPPKASYHACDLDGRAVAFLNRCAPFLGKGFQAVHADLLRAPPAEEADVAFLLKAATSLERQERGATRRLLDALRVRNIVVSFPIASLGGRDRGMRRNYERAFRALLGHASWTVERLEFPAELAFVVHKPLAATFSHS